MAENAKMIRVTKGAQTIEIHPRQVKQHEGLGWSRVAKAKK